MRAPRTLPPSLLALAAAAALAADPAAPAPAAPAEPKFEMTKYQFVLLARDAARPAPAADEARHRALLAGLVARGTALVEGPLEGAADVAELVVLDLPGPEAALAALKDDPLVAGGALVPRVLTWFAAKDQLRRPPDPAAREDAVFGLLVRPANAPDLPQEKLDALQAGHMDNIRAMAASGDLVWAGPFVDGGTLRGVFVFRTTDLARLRQLVARDPAVAAGRLAVQLYPWRVGKGSLPPR